MKTPTEQKRIIRKFYGLDRPVTEDEWKAEIAMLERKRDMGTLCDFAAVLAAKLGVI